MDDISYKVRLLDPVNLMHAVTFKQTYNALAHHVTHANLNRRLKTVSLWSLQMTANATLTALRNIVDSAQFRKMYISP